MLYEIFEEPSIVHMKKSLEKRGRGRPRTHWTGIYLTLLPHQVDAVNAWIERQDETDLTRQEAIRRLIEAGLAAAPKRKRP
jgi:hypothetical protein